MRPVTLAWVSSRLEKLYGRPRGRSGDPPLAVFVKAILSQNTTDANRDRAYKRLRERFGTWEQVESARIRSLERSIRVAGLCRGKARAIRELLDYVRRSFGRLDEYFLCRMDTGEALRELTRLRGIGVKTVSVALMFGCGRDDVFPVDTHILRVSKRLGLVPASAAAERAHRILAPMVPDGSAASLHLNMIRHGRETCRARAPVCRDCVLRSRCPFARRRAGVGGSRS